MFRPNLFLSVSLTWRCFHKCWYCCCNPYACASGAHIDTAALLGFYDVLEKAQREGLIRSFVEVKYTGGGEPLNHPDLVDVAVSSQRFGCRSNMLTAGASSPMTAQRIQAVRGVIDDLRISHDPESEASYERIRRTLGCSISPAEIDSMLSPDKPPYFGLRTFERIGKMAESLGYKSQFVSGKNANTGQDTMGFLYHGHGNVVAHTVDRVESAGAALPRLQHYKQKLNTANCSSVHTPRQMDIHILPEGYLTYCCCHRAKAVQPMTLDGLVAMIKGFSEVQKTARRGLKAHLGEEVHHPCDVCPLYD